MYLHCQTQNVSALIVSYTHIFLHQLYVLQPTVYREMSVLIYTYM